MSLPAFALSGARARVVVEGGEGLVAAAIVRLADGEAVGVIELEDLGETLRIHRLCIFEAHRGYGLGTDVARALRLHAEGGPWVRMLAAAAPDLGLSVYFWTRMGFRPLHGEGPGGGIWFERVLRARTLAG